MKVLSKEAAMLWCQAHGVALHWKLPDRAQAEFRFKIPSDAQARVGLVDQAMKIFANEHQFLVWFDDWGVWSGQRMHVFDRFRLSYGVAHRLIDSPAICSMKPKSRTPSPSLRSPYYSCGTAMSSCRSSASSSIFHTTSSG